MPTLKKYCENFIENIVTRLNQVDDSVGKKGLILYPDEHPIIRNDAAADCILKAINGRKSIDGKKFFTCEKDINGYLVIFIKKEIIKKPIEELDMSEDVPEATAKELMCDFCRVNVVLDRQLG